MGKIMQKIILIICFNLLFEIGSYAVEKVEIQGSLEQINLIDLVRGLGKSVIYYDNEGILDNNETLAVVCISFVDSCSMKTMLSAFIVRQIGLIDSCDNLSYCKLRGGGVIKSQNWSEKKIKYIEERLWPLFYNAAMEDNDIKEAAIKVNIPVYPENKQSCQINCTLVLKIYPGSYKSCLNEEDKIQP